MLCSNQLSDVATKYRYPVIGARILATVGVFVNRFRCVWQQRYNSGYAAACRDFDHTFIKSRSLFTILISASFILLRYFP